MSQTESAPVAPEHELIIKLDTSKLEQVLAEHLVKLQELLKPKEETITTTISPVDEARKNFREWLTKSVTEAVSGIPTTYTFTRDLLVLPPAIEAGLLDFVQKITIPRGANEARVYKINVPAFSTLVDKTEAPEVSQTISTVTITLSERGARQVVSYREIEQSSVDLVTAIEDSFTRAAAVDLEKMIIDVLASDAGVTFDSSANPFIVNTLLQAKRLLIEQSKRMPRQGELILVLHPKQYFDLLTDSKILSTFEFGSPEPIRKGLIPEVLGVNVVVSDQVPANSAAGTYDALLFYRDAVALATSRDLMIEAFREPPKRVISLTASYVAGAKLIDNKWACKITTQ